MAKDVGKLRIKIYGITGMDRLDPYSKEMRADDGNLTSCHIIGWELTVEIYIMSYFL